MEACAYVGGRLAISERTLADSERTLADIRKLCDNDAVALCGNNELRLPGGWSQLRANQDVTGGIAYCISVAPDAAISRYAFHQSK